MALLYLDKTLRGCSISEHFSHPASVIERLKEGELGYERTGSFTGGD